MKEINVEIALVVGADGKYVAAEVGEDGSEDAFQYCYERGLEAPTMEYIVKLKVTTPAHGAKAIEVEGRIESQQLHDNQ